MKNSKGTHFAGSSAKECLRSNGRMRKPLDAVREVLDATSERLRNVLVESRDFADILRHYDSP